MFAAQHMLPPPRTARVEGCIYRQLYAHFAADAARYACRDILRASYGSATLDGRRHTNTPAMRPELPMRIMNAFLRSHARQAPE